MAAALRKFGVLGAPSVKVAAPAGDPPRGRNDPSSVASSSGPAASQAKPTAADEPRKRDGPRRPAPERAAPPELNDYMRSKVPRGEVGPALAVHAMHIPTTLRRGQAQQLLVSPFLTGRCPGCKQRPARATVRTTTPRATERCWYLTLTFHNYSRSESSLYLFCWLCTSWHTHGVQH